MSLAFLFGGPGIASPGMGRDLYNKNPLVRESVDKADKVMNELGGVRPTKACFAGDEALMRRPSVAGPAVLALAHGVVRFLRSKRLHPQMAGALGWGEVVALGALGAWDLDASLKLLYERGCWVEEAWAKQPWHALAVQGLAPEALEARLAALPEPPQRCALISPDHFVLLGSEVLLQKLHDLLAQAGRHVKVTPVEPGWHWPHPSLAPLGPKFEALVAGTPHEHLATPIQGAAEAEAMRQAREYPGRLALSFSQGLDWPAACRRLKLLHMDTAVEIGHGSALGAAMHAMDHDVRVLATEDLPSLSQTLKLAN